jgi:ABC-type Na+ efflux pump permease subunit
MKCYRLEPGKDIVDGKVFIGGERGKSVKSLAKELAEERTSTVEDGGIMPGDVQNWLSFFLGLVIVIILGAFLFVWIFSSIFTNYREAQGLYKNPISASALSSSVLPKDWSFLPASWFGAKCPAPAPAPAPVPVPNV